LRSEHEYEVRTGERFAFGANWTRFLSALTENAIAQAVTSLQTMLRRRTLGGLTFLDAGSGSGLFSLAAHRLGAEVVSFDFDPQSVACTAELRRREGVSESAWRVEAGSVLDKNYLAQLGRFDIVYSWGVLHHTGSLTQALENVVTNVAEGGMLFIALYNDQGWMSRYWSAIKRRYNRNVMNKMILTALHAPYLYGARLAFRALTGRLRFERGMSLWYDMIDWLGGWPFEVARPKDVVAFYRSRGFELLELRTVGSRSGCNEFVFRRLPRS
jgi:2-polyprenyl-3-methyl-5-hydroxy-6-metoxy-1,4-benzoquinol methylase